MKVIGRLPGEASCLNLVWAVLDRASRGWRGMTMAWTGTRLLNDYATNYRLTDAVTTHRHHQITGDETVGAVAEHDHRGTELVVIYSEWDATRLQSDQVIGEDELPQRAALVRSSKRAARRQRRCRIQKVDRETWTSSAPFFARGGALLS